MNSRRTDKPPGLSSGKVMKLIVGIVVFGVLMGIRPEFGQIWERTLVAACAGGVLGWAILQTRKDKV